MIAPVVKLAKRLAPNVAGVTVNGRRGLWVRAPMRRTRGCWLCKRMIRKGQLAWRTLGNEQHRPERVCSGDEGCWP